MAHTVYIENRIPPTNHRIELSNSGHSCLTGTCQMGGGHRGLLDQEDKQDENGIISPSKSGFSTVFAATTLGEIQPMKRVHGRGASSVCVQR